jgi:FKBP-type peptidyl-prolyl cis-trans isomerase
MRFLSLIVFIAVFFLFSCENENKDIIKHKKLDKHAFKENMAEANKHLLKNEKQDIQDFINRYHYKMTETGTGLYYEIYKNGNGEQARKGKIAELNFTVRLLNGQVVYKSDEEGVKEFKIGKGGVESGLEEGILLLHVGDHARFILPSHLAFGLLGDRERIPAKAAIVYDIELINLK